MIQKDKRYIIFLLVIIGATVIWWFREGLILVPSETCYFLNPSSNFYEYLFAWDSTVLAGYPILQMAGLIFPFKTFFLILGATGMPLFLSQIIYYILTLSLAGVSMYLLVRHLMTDCEKFRVAPLISALFYIYNSYLLIHIVNIAFLSVFSVLPLMLLFLMKGIESKSGWLKYSIGLSLCFMSLATCAINFPHLGSVFIILGLYLIYSLLIVRESSLARVVKFLSSTFIISLFLSLFWIVPFIIVLGDKSSMTPLNAASIGSWHQRGASSILDAFRLLGFWWWDNMPFARMYASPALIIATLSVPVFSFSLIFYRRLEKRLYFFLMLLLTGVFLVKAQHPPFGFIFKWATEHIWGFWVYREPYSKFSIITLFSCAVTLGVGVELFYRKLIDNGRGRLAQLFKVVPFSVLCIVIILFSAWPLVIGYAFPTYRVWSKISPMGKDVTTCHNAFVTIPDYYKKAASFVNNDRQDFRILLTPIHRGGIYQRWGLGYSGVAPEQFLFRKAVIIPASLGSGSSYLPEIFDRLFVYQNEYSSEPFKEKNIFKFLGLLNVRYIEQRNDFGQEFLNAGITPLQTSEYMTTLLGSLSDIPLSRRFGKLDFYGNKYWLPMVYLDYSPLVVNEGLEVLPDLMNSAEFGRQRSVFFNQNVPRIGEAPGSKGIEKVGFSKINPVKYAVTFNLPSLDSKPFWIVFSESFHRDWKAYVVKGHDLIELKQHKMINGYANSWLIDGKALDFIRNPGTKIYIEYTPQIFYRLAITVSLVSLLICILLLILLRVRSEI